MPRLVGSVWLGDFCAAELGTDIETEKRKQKSFLTCECGRERKKDVERDRGAKARENTCDFGWAGGPGWRDEGTGDAISSLFYPSLQSIYVLLVLSSTNR